MKLPLLNTLSLLALSMSPISSLHATTGAEAWGSNLEAAKTEAAKTDRDLFMNFTGSDW